MASRFDNVAKALATGMSRRKALKLFTGGAAAAVATTVAGKESTVDARERSGWTINYTGPIRGTVVVPVPAFPIPFVNQNVNTPQPQPPSNDPLPGIDGDEWAVPPGVDIKLGILPKLVPFINWQFDPFDPTRR